MTHDPGTALRRALGLSEPDYGPQYRSQNRFCGMRNADDLAEDDANQHLWRVASDEEIEAEKVAVAERIEAQRKVGRAA